MGRGSGAVEPDELGRPEYGDAGEVEEDGSAHEQENTGGRRYGYARLAETVAGTGQSRSWTASWPGARVGQRESVMESSGTRSTPRMEGDRISSSRWEAQGWRARRMAPTRHANVVEMWGRRRRNMPERRGRRAGVEGSRRSHWRRWRQRSSGQCVAGHMCEMRPELMLLVDREVLSKAQRQFCWISLVTAG
jgi:hypothetical protein